MTAVQTRLPTPLEETGSHDPAPDHRVRRRRIEPRAFRPDIEGLRAIAVVLVVLYHAELAFPGGYVGVDVFFVISGFLITRQLVKNVSRDGARALPTFYAHRIRRLLPASIVVVIATIVAARIWAPVLTVRDIALDGLFSTFYGLNYRLASLGTDYQHMGDAASPLQHFWSLGVEEQFYLVWPILVVAIFGLARRRAHAVLVATVLAVIVVSAYYSLTVTAESAPWAYFSLHTRAWELGLGALVALFAGHLAQLPAPLRNMAATAGLVAIAASALAYSDSTPFPGVAAWLPVGGATLVIAAGCGPRVPVERLLAEPLMQVLGRISYSWYLWHWPLLVIAPMAVGHELDWLGRSTVVWLSLVAALLSFFLVEEPARRFHLSNIRWLGIGLALSGVVVATAVAAMVFPPSLTGNGASTTVARSTTASATVPAPMSDAIAAGVSTQEVPRNLQPQPADAADSLPQDRDTGCHADFTQVDQGACVFGDKSADRTVVLFGDSHMEQWLPAFIAAADRDHWRVVSWTKSACPPGEISVHDDVLNRTYTECDEWRARTIDRIGELDPDRVVVSQAETLIPGSVSPTTYADALASTMRKLADGTTGTVSFLQDIPIPGSDLPGCVASNLDDATGCAFPAERAYSYPDRHAAIEPALSAVDVGTIPTQPWFCSETACPPIVGNILVYRDDSHMTVPYSEWLLPLARSVLREGTPGNGTNAATDPQTRR